MSINRNLSSNTSIRAITAALAVAFSASVAQAQDVKSISVDAQSLSDALVELSALYDVTIFGDDALIDAKVVPVISGAYSLEEALELTLDGTGLEARPSATGGYLIKAAAAAPQTSADQSAPVSTSQVEADETVSKDNSILDQIVVTGSRIERTAVNSPTPIDIVTEREIDNLGLNDVTEALRFVPALNQSISFVSEDTTGLPGGSAEIGLSTLNLRGLGAERTLVLVNGKRHVGGVVGQATVDVSSIPQALIEQVEILTGGGSSIYGADAVSGVVNFIIKDDFEGIAYEGSFTQPTEGDAQNYFASVTLGGNFGGGRGNAVINAEYNFQDNLSLSDRPEAVSGSAIVGNTLELAELTGFSAGEFANVLIPDATSPFFSLLGPLVSFGPTFPAILGARDGAPDTAGVPLLQVFETETGILRPAALGLGDAFSLSGGDGVPLPFFGNTGDIVPQVERFSFNGFADYDITPQINAFLEVKYNNSEATNVLASDFTLFSQPIALDNPFVPQALLDQAELLGADAVTISFTTASEPVLNLPEVTERETFRIVGGFKGEVASWFNYEVSANYGLTDIDENDTGALLPDRFLASVDVVDGPDGPTCASTLDPDFVSPLAFLGVPRPPATFTPGAGSDCVPFNLFAPPTAEVADFLFVPTTNRSTLDQLVLNATVTGTSEDFFSLPAGAISYAAGIEYREEDSSFQPDALLSPDIDLGALPEAPAIAGGFDVIEGFAEVNIPLLADLPLVKALNFDASARVADYSTVGTTVSFAFGALYQPVEDFRIRGSFNRSVRAPNIGELFAPQIIALSSFTTSEDPCAPDPDNPGQLLTPGPDPAVRLANCAALIPGSLDDFEPVELTIGAGTLIPLTLGGNPFLSEETANTFTIGFTATPSFIPGLSVVADFYTVDIDDAIEAAVGQEGVLANCVDAPSIANAFCGAITRDPATGEITAISDTALNIGALRSTGIDYQIGYNFDLDRFFDRDIGEFTASLAGTYLIEREDTPLADFPDTVDRLDGEFGFPRNFFNFALGWSKGPWRADYGFNFQSNQVITSFGGGFDIDEQLAFVDLVTSDDDPANDGLQLVGGTDSGSAFVHNIGGSYTLSENFEFSIRVNNLGDRDPFPFLQGGFVRPVSFIGRTVQFGIRGRF